MGAESGPPPAACLLPPGRRQCRSWLGSRGGPCDWWGRKSRLLRAALAGRPCCCPSPLFQSPRLSHMPHFPVVAVTVAELASPFACQVPPAARAAVPGVTRGTGRTWTCSVAWRDPISEAKLRLTETRRLVPSPSPCSGTFLKFLLYPCLRSSVICAPSLLLPDTPTPCQSLPGAFLSGQPQVTPHTVGKGLGGMNALVLAPQQDI